jgi:2-dehydropantoate 2-reductase
VKVLVYGSGVIGSYLAHVLCTAGNDVTMLARGKWKEQLEKNGLRIRHHLQHKETLDHPAVIEAITDDQAYDIVFAVMPYNRIGAILEPLAAVHAPLVVMVGNNMNPAEMQQTILEKTVCPKEVLFAFQATAGKRDQENGILVCERLGTGNMDIGGLHVTPDETVQNKLETVFSGSGYKLRWQPDMEAYLICHLAAVLPICYLAYACNGDLRSANGKQRKQMRLASREAYGMLESRGIPILPAEDEKYYEPGVKGTLMQFVYFLMSKTEMGDLIACAHCRNAWEEMKMLDKAFEQVIAKAPDYLMPNWNALKTAMPSWEAIQKQYGRKEQRS